MEGHKHLTFEERCELTEEEFAAYRAARLAYISQRHEENMAKEAEELAKNPRTPEEQAEWEEMCRHMADKMQSSFGPMSDKWEPRSPEEMRGLLDFNTLIGLSIKEAAILIAGYGFTYRIIQEDGVGYMATSDMREDRLGLTLVDKKVTAVQQG